MAKKASDILICIDAGHGMSRRGDTYKETPNIPGVGIIKEFEFNKAVAGYLEQALKRCGFRTLRTSTTDVDIPLPTRCAIANKAKADLFVSCHYNHSGQKHPGGRGAAGVETYYYYKLSSTSEAAKVARAVQNELIHSDIIKQPNRGVKTGDYQVLRETVMSAILIEYGFMDDEFQNYLEARAMLNPAWQKERAERTAMGICKHYKVPYVAPTSTSATQPAKELGMYRVFLNGKHIGSWKTQDYAVLEIATAVSVLKFGQKAEIVVEKI